MFLPFSPYITHSNSKNATCPLFKQMKLSIDEKVQNFESLIESQLDLKTLAEMDDLETAMRGLNSFWWRWSSRYCSSHGKLDVSGEESCLYKEGEFIIGLFTSGTPGEVTSTSSWFPVWLQLISLHLWDLSSEKSILEEIIRRSRRNIWNSQKLCLTNLTCFVLQQL